MALAINTNTPSLFLQRNISSAQDRIDTSLQRLSTGLRINSAKDDAAGLAIATRLSSQIIGLNQAIRNSNDGISIFQLGEASLDEVTNNLQRIRELAVSAANASLSSSDREALDAEASQRLNEINRIATVTRFNDRRVLDGSSGSLTFQVGPNVGNTLSVSLNAGVKTTQIGQIASAEGANEVSSSALTASGLSITIGSESAVAVGASSAGAEAGQDADSAFAKTEAINAAGISGLTVSANTADTTYTLDDVTGGLLGGTFTLDINGVSIYSSEPIAILGTLGASTIASEISNNSGDTGVSASFTGGQITLSVGDGRNIEVTQTFTGGASGGFQSGGGDLTTDTTRGKITLTASQEINLSGDIADIGFTSASISIDTSTLAGISLDTVSGAEEAIFRVDSALTSVSSLRSEFGQYQAAFESVVSSLDGSQINLSQARSRIQDADFAKEVLQLTKNQVLQEAGITLLAQANINPRQALQLLEDL